MLRRHAVHGRLQRSRLRGLHLHVQWPDGQNPLLRKERGESYVPIAVGRLSLTEMAARARPYLNHVFGGGM
jgi:hypothetical protein